MSGFFAWFDAQPLAFWIGCMALYGAFIIWFDSKEKGD